jgi:glycosyltransferase involved in cell wall biosynthesis
VGGHGARYAGRIPHDHGGSCLKVSLIGTVLNAADSVEEFLASLDAQTLRPDEVVIVDGGSTDGTADLLRRSEAVTVIEESGANIARGRNVAIAAAAHDVLAVTDVDCVLEPEWLRHLLLPIDEGADVAMGFYAPIAEGLFQECMAAVNLPVEAAEVDPRRFMPSARSLAFRREALEAAGGYPEWLPIGEDMWVNHRWRELGLDMRFAPEAVVRWRLRASLASTWQQYFRYARGDAHAGMYPERHALRFGVYTGGLLAARSGRRLPLALGAAGALAYARTPLRRAWTRLGSPTDRAAATALVPVLMAWIDTAKMAGYVAGLTDRVRRG